MGEGASRVFKDYGESLKCIQREYTPNMGSNRTEVVHSRIPPKLRERMGTLILRDYYDNESRFIKEVIVEKLKREE